MNSEHLKNHENANILYGYKCIYLRSLLKFTGDEMVYRVEQEKGVKP